MRVLREFYGRDPARTGPTRAEHSWGEISENLPRIFRIDVCAWDTVSAVTTRKRATKTCPAPPEQSLSAPLPALPAWKAFVVQFTRETGVQPAVFAGRVEHLSSGRRVHFSSAEELTAILAKLLDEVGHATP